MGSVKRSDPIKSALSWEERKEIGDFGVFRDRLTEDDIGIVARFDSQGDQNIQKAIEEMTGSEIRELRKHIAEERLRTILLDRLLCDAEYQITRSLV